MTNDYGRRIGVLETNMSEVQKCIIRLEAHEEEAIKHRKEVEDVMWKNGDKAIVPTMARIESKIDASSGTSLTFKWLAEKFGLPFVLAVIMLIIGIVLGSGT